MKSIEITILGAGNGGRAFSAYLAQADHNVTLVYHTREKVETIIQSKEIWTEGQFQGNYPIAHITNSYKKAIPNANLILFVLPASIHSNITRHIIPYLKSNQIILLNPGRTWGAIEVYNLIKKYRPELNIYVGETETLLFTSRKLGDYGVSIFKIKNSVDYCIYPEHKMAEIQPFIESIFPPFHPVSDIRITSLNNFGAILHPTISILNAGAISRGDRFLFYRDGVTEEVARIIGKIDIERMMIMNSLGLPVMSFLDWVDLVYNYQASDYFDAFQHIKSYDSIYAPTELLMRYLTEDVPTGLVPLASLGEFLGIKTPSIKSIIHLSNLLLNEDFYQTGRTIERVGVPHRILQKNYIPTLKFSGFTTEEYNEFMPF